MTTGPSAMYLAEFPSEGGVLVTADHITALPYYDGRSTDVSPGTGVMLGVNDADTVKLIGHDTSITEGSVLSVHIEDESTSYLNGSGAIAYAALILKCTGGGTEERHIKIFSSGTENSATGTELFEIGSTTGTNKMDANDERLTVGPLRVGISEYLNIQNVDDSRTGTNSITVDEACWVVERGS